MMPWWLLSTVAVAQTVEDDFSSVDGQLYHPPIDNNAYLWADNADVGDRGFQPIRAVFNYANAPVVYVDFLNEPTELISDLYQVNLLGAYAIGPIRAGIDIPVFLQSLSETQGSESGLGDVAFDAKGQILKQGRAPLGLAIAGRLGLPTSTIENAPLGSPGVVWEAEGIVCLLYTSPSPRDRTRSRMPSSA